VLQRIAVLASLRDKAEMCTKNARRIHGRRRAREEGCEGRGERGRHLSQEEFPRNPCGEKTEREETGHIIREKCTSRIQSSIRNAASANLNCVQKKKKKKDFSLYRE